jgi:TATA-binding protein-associated factor Taf7
MSNVYGFKEEEAFDNGEMDEDEDEDEDDDVGNGEEANKELITDTVPAMKSCIGIKRKRTD